MANLAESSRREIIDKALGGAEATALHSAATDALHAYAHATNCQPGGDVVKWYNDKAAEAVEAVRTALGIPG